MLLFIRAVLVQSAVPVLENIMKERQYVSQKIEASETSLISVTFNAIPKPIKTEMYIDGKINIGVACNGPYILLANQLFRAIRRKPHISARLDAFVCELQR
jgi:hypothetical protein